MKIPLHISLIALIISSCVFSEDSKQSSKPDPTPAPIFKPEFGTLVDNRDGQNYKTSLYGGRTMIVDNMRFDADGSVCDTNCDQGRKYPMSAILKICPTGFHIPTLREWSDVVDHLYNKDREFDQDTFALLNLDTLACAFWGSDGDSEDGMVFGARCFTHFLRLDIGSATEQSLQYARCIDGDYPAIPSNGSILKKGELVEIDGEMYPTFQIGQTLWMAKNLNSAREGSRCYDDQESNCDKYGRLYLQDSVLSICPDGWSLPQYRNWAAFDSALAGRLYAPTLLRSMDTAWGDLAGNVDLGFNALPGGSFNGSSFQSLGSKAVWWSGDQACYEWQTGMFHGMCVRYGRGAVRLDANLQYLFQLPTAELTDESSLASVRCIKQLE